MHQARRSRPRRSITASRAATSLLAAGGFALFLASTAVAQTKGDIDQPAGGATVTTTTRHGGWTVVCTRAAGQETESCNANFRVINSQTKANLLVWLFGFNAKGERLAEFRTLTEVLIQPGVVVAIDGDEPLRASYVSCGTSGCQATLSLDDDMIERLRNAKAATVSMTRTDGQVIQMKMEIPGIALALRDVGF